tara:strand:- start:1714 stop:2832 length:1119 start_codon:yes stop_codon:yes gene_type:complete
MLQRFIPLFFITIIILSSNVLAKDLPIEYSNFNDDILLYDSSSSGTNVHVDEGDTLWNIAFNLRLDLKVSMSQMMLAIFNENPNAFEGNVNVLKKNSTLMIPFSSQVIDINSEFAFNEVQRQHANWNIIEEDISHTLPSLPTDLIEPADINRELDATLIIEDQFQSQKTNFLNGTDDYDFEIIEPAPENPSVIVPKKESKSDLSHKNKLNSGDSEINSNTVVDQDGDPQSKNRINSNEVSSIDIVNSASKSAQEKTIKTIELVSIWTILLFIIIVIVGVSRFMREDSSSKQSTEKNKASQRKISEKTKSEVKDPDLSSNGTISIIGTKLDLARAYVDMGDLVKALTILEEVLDEGNELQKKEAKSLLKNISK